MPRFEASITNQTVARDLSEGRKPRQLDEGWAENRYIEITAAHELDARRKLEARYPVARGFVILGITQISD
jgi:hypothetical protein